MRRVDCWIVNYRAQPVIVRFSSEMAYQFIEAQPQPINPNEWSIFRTKADLPSSDRTIAGSLEVNIPKHVLE